MVEGGEYTGRVRVVGGAMELKKKRRLMATFRG